MIVFTLTTLAMLGLCFLAIRFAVRANRWIRAHRGLIAEATVGGYIRHSIGEWVDSFEHGPARSDRDDDLDDDTVLPDAMASNDQTASPD